MKQLGPKCRMSISFSQRFLGSVALWQPKNIDPSRQLTLYTYVGAILTFLFRLASHVPSFISSVSSFFTFCILPSIQIVFCPSSFILIALLS